MKRPFALAAGLAVVIGLVLAVANPGLATAAPPPRPPGHQQAIDAVMARALAQRGVPFTYGGGDASGPTRRPVDVTRPTEDPADPSTSGLSLPGVPQSSTTMPGMPAAVPDADANVVGFDASGLVVYAFAGVGLKLPRSSGEQYKVGWKITPDEALPGDLIFYGPEGTQSVAMFLGSGQMLEATDPGVTVSPVRTKNMAPYLSRIIS